MSQERPQLFGRTRFLIGQVDDFLDKLAEGAVLFEHGLLALIEEGVNEGTEQKADQLKELKERCKELRRNVVNTLVGEMLIPDFRGDVLSLLSNLFRLLDVMGRTYIEFLIEHQSSLATVDITPSSTSSLELRRHYKELISVVVKSVLATVSAARAFFRSPAAVHDHINLIRIYENEADVIALRLKRLIYSLPMSLEKKSQMRDATDVIDAIADMAEDLSDDLAVYAIKREL